MARYFWISAALGAVAGFLMSMVFNGIESVGIHLFNVVISACYFTVPGFLLWLASRSKSTNRSN